MAFDGGFNPILNPIRVPPRSFDPGNGTIVDRAGLTSPAVPPSDTSPTGTGTDTTSKPTLSPEAGLFGGRLPPSRTGTTAQEHLEGERRRFESFHQPQRIAGPLVLGEQGTGSVPIHPLPAHAAEAFAFMARGGQR
jgi:hypothetical protein